MQEFSVFSASFSHVFVCSRQCRLLDVDCTNTTLEQITETEVLFTPFLPEFCEIEPSELVIKH